MPNDIIMIRHAQSTWNAQSKFTGWADPPLTTLGESEAERAAATLGRAGYVFDVVYTSVLQRAQKTADIILDELQLNDIPVHSDWRLNERHYGGLQGLDKVAMAKDVGEKQVLRWRRGFLDMPPALEAEDERHPRFDARYQHIPSEKLPSRENLLDTQNRAKSFWQDRIPSHLAAGDKVLISSHGNTLRALIMFLSGMSEKEVETFEIPTGVPIVYRFDKNGQPESWHYLD
ncbi:2,3-bisphosphoglycerate-dependent phosphoglycerate mutase [Teredinibacter sp. KSP-S5-2]|uniref:2,3-bisphosphoglycerate-dependent phosphoglycerate mutase n=1 Tax=Teredinibacter sp. KSP-S5-2 TaxID=3034506 RepID=UPI0029345B5F|nr:2,3-bisphosphoglycerate-dependent phosphoglycerate mutase [Teredinibacter sp. KSP-S5-2]WNO09184.1 2,3-bisphosphoglycerate-dependent phosphoglycerate mutase [Teredinibacter sp. KSP-S5-2]